MTPEERRDLVGRFYSLNAKGERDAAEELLTDDFVITTPSYMPFGGTFRGKGAFRELIPLVASTIPLGKLDFLETTVGEEFAVELVDFTLDGHEGPLRVAEVIRFRGEQICEITPFYFDPAPWIAAGKRKKAASESGGQAS
jgi:ketosteroid isomerase-like protein